MNPPKAECLLLTCFDYRLPPLIAAYMARRGLAGRYDHVALAGAALGVVSDRYPAWDVTFWQSLELAIQLHGIRRVVVMDHRDCGAYRLLLGEEAVKDPTSETLAHTRVLQTLRQRLEARHGDLELELLLLAMDGTVEPIA